MCGHHVCGLDFSGSGFVFRENDVPNTTELFFLSGLMSDSVQVGEEIAGDEERSGMK